VHKHGYGFFERVLKRDGRMKKVNTLLIKEAASSIETWKLSVLDPQKIRAAASL
jgi:hypothetical protein